MTEPRAITPLNIRNLSRQEFDELKADKWDDEFRASTQTDGLPLHLRSTVRIVTTHGNRNWENQAGISIPGSSVLRMYAASGAIDMGWHRLVGPSGRFLDNGEILGPAGPDFTREGVNRYCMLVQTPKVFFKNSDIPNWGASIEGYWRVGQNDGGQLMTAFNDNDNNNTGTFSMYVEWMEASVFADWIAHLIR